MGSRKPSKTSHLLIRRTYGGKLYHRYHSYSNKSDANDAAKRLRKDGKSVRIHKSPNEEYKYTVYKRG